MIDHRTLAITHCAISMFMECELDCQTWDVNPKHVPATYRHLILKLPHSNDDTCVP